MLLWKKSQISIVLYNEGSHLFHTIQINKMSILKRLFLYGD